MLANKLIELSAMPLTLTSLSIQFQAELQKMRVEMAAMKRDAEHYSRQVRNLFLFDQEIEYNIYLIKYTWVCLLMYAPLFSILF